MADFADPKRRDQIVDLCSGGGIIPLLWISGGKTGSMVYGVELQRECCELAKRSIAANGDVDKFSIIEGDLREIKNLLPRGKFSLVTCNPPYFPVGSGAESQFEERRLARSEASCNSHDICAAARYLLKYGGRLCLCQRPERLADVICAMRENDIEPKRIRTVHQKDRSSPWLILIEGRYGGKPEIKFSPPLIMTDDNGKYTEELQRIYGGYGEAVEWRDN